MSPDSSSAGVKALDVAIVGAGFAGLYMLHRARTLGFSARVFEAGRGVGGTWYWNRYPGARCDMESMQYSYQFSEALQQEWDWSERYAAQPEILAYLEHVADRFELRHDIQLGTRVTRAVFDDTAGRWVIETEHGERSSARFLIMATGCLSARKHLDIPGLESFGGQLLHTSEWPQEEVVFRNKRVGIVGTGSTGIQLIPIVAEQAKQLYVFQRTPAYTVPARNGPIDPSERASIKANYPAFRRANMQTPFGTNLAPSSDSVLDVDPETLRQRLDAEWEKGGFGFLTAFSDILTSHEANERVAGFVREKIAAIVDEPALAAALTPRHAIACKRLCLDTGYYETFNRPNVTLVDLSQRPIEAVTRSGVRAGRDIELDMLIFATGFDAMTGALLAIDIRGTDGRSLREAWADGPVSYLGLGVAGFPNLFTVTGPGSPSVLTNMIPTIEQHVNWIADCLAFMRSKSFHRIEATPEAQAAWVDHVREIANATLFPTCSSWYMGANVPGKPRVFMPYIGLPGYIARCEDIVANGYAGFTLGREGVPAADRSSIP